MNQINKVDRLIGLNFCGSVLHVDGKLGLLTEWVDTRFHVLFIVQTI